MNYPAHDARKKFFVSKCGFLCYKKQALEKKSSEFGEWLKVFITK